MNSVLLLGSDRDLHAERLWKEPDLDELHQIQLNVVKLTSDVEHIKTDVADIKIDLRRIAGDAVAADQKMTGKVDGLDLRAMAKIEALDHKLTGKIDELDGRLTAKIDAVDQKLTDKIDAVDQRLTGKIDALRDEFASAKIWALGLYFGLATSMLFVMAKGFKWI